MKRVSSFITAFLMAAFSLSGSAGVFAADTADTASYEMNVKVDLSDKGIAISPYVFGVNEHGISDGLTVNSVRQGGNRYTAYNWETNYSNAGSDWQMSSDTYLSSSSDPADCAQQLSKKAEKRDIDYKLVTLQMAGYASADKNGTVEETEAAPSDRWVKVEPAKGSEFSMEPDLTDGVVYMDEYVNYLVTKLGDASTSTGIQAYSLDNEPALWNHTHPLIQKDVLKCEELVDKSIALATAAKAVDPKAEIFGPALFGYSAFAQLQDEDDWKATNTKNYNWFVDYYLDEMKNAEKESGKRLLDVLDIHFYSEARGTCDTRMCADPTHTECIDEMLQSYRTLCEKDYKENSWIGQWCQQNIPILGTINKSIDTYYPGTKLAVTEYDFGGGKTIAGAIAEIDVLGTFIKNNVYFATLWAEKVPYQYSAINMFTNFDGKGTSFGDTLISAETDDYVKSTAYAGVNGEKRDEVSVIVTNKSQTQTEKAVISLENTDIEYKNAAVYMLTGDSSDIVHKLSIEKIDDNTLVCELPPLCAAEIYITSDEEAVRPVERVDEGSSDRKEAELTETEEGYHINFGEKLSGSVILDIDLIKESPMGSGCIAFNVTLDGEYYWVPYGWSVNASGEAEISLDMPDSAYKASTDETLKDEDLLKEIAKCVRELTEADAQIWYVADAAWGNADLSGCTIKGAYHKKSFIWGDLDESGEVDLSDLTVLSQHLLKDIKLEGTKLSAADVNGDDEVDIRDIALLKQYVMNDQVKLGK